MAYKLQRTGDSVRDLLNAVENKTIYPDASTIQRGLMSAADKAKLNSLEIKYNTTAYWNSYTGYVPPAGTIIIYSDHETIEHDGQTFTIPGLKIGNGNAYVQDLNFADDAQSEALLGHMSDQVKHLTQEERACWNNKLNISDSQEVVDRTLIFNRN